MSYLSKKFDAQSINRKKSLFFLRNRCCHTESDLVFNQTLLAAITECKTESKKAMKKVESPEENLDGDGGLYNMYSCDRMKRWKMMVSCTIDCVAQKIGMVKN